MTIERPAGPEPGAPRGVSYVPDAPYSNNVDGHGNDACLATIGVHATGATMAMAMTDTLSSSRWDDIPQQLFSSCPA